MACEPGTCTIVGHSCMARDCKEHRKTLDPVVDRRRCDTHRKQLLELERFHPTVFKSKCAVRGCNRQAKLRPGYHGFSTCPRHGGTKVKDWSWECTSWTKRRLEVIRILKSSKLEGQHFNLREVCSPGCNRLVLFKVPVSMLFSVPCRYSPCQAWHLSTPACRVWGGPWTN